MDGLTADIEQLAFECSYALYGDERGMDRFRCAIRDLMAGDVEPLRNPPARPPATRVRRSKRSWRQRDAFDKGRR